MYYDLVLHDFGNLSFQIISTSDSKSELDRIADNLNYVFIRAGRSKQFLAEVLVSDMDTQDIGA